MSAHFAHRGLLSESLKRATTPGGRTTTANYHRHSRVHTTTKTLAKTLSRPHTTALHVTPVELTILVVTLCLLVAILICLVWAGLEYAVRLARGTCGECMQRRSSSEEEEQRRVRRRPGLGFVSVGQSLKGSMYSLLSLCSNGEKKRDRKESRSEDVETSGLLNGESRNFGSQLGPRFDYVDAAANEAALRNHWNHGDTTSESSGNTIMVHKKDRAWQSEVPRKRSVDHDIEASPKD